MKELNITKLNMVAGGNPEAAAAYLDELCKKYGVKYRMQALAMANSEEKRRHAELWLAD